MMINFIFYADYLPLAKPFILNTTGLVFTFNAENCNLVSFMSVKSSGMANVTALTSSLTY